MTTETIVSRIGDHVQSSPDRECIHFRDLGSETPSDTTLTYADVWSRANAVRPYLDFLKPGEHVVIVMPLGPALLVAQLGVLLTGGIASIFTHPSEKIASAVYTAKLEHAVKAFHPRAILTIASYLANVSAAARPDTRIVVVPEIVSATASFSEPYKFVVPRDTAIIQYSSGSTGLQKAVALSHDMVLDQCDSYARAIGLSASDRVCSWLPLYHDMGLFTSWLMPVLKGVPVSLIDPFLWVKQPQSLLSLISDVGGSLCWLPNFSFNLLAQRVSPDFLSEIDLSSMRGFVNCSEPVSASSLREFHAAFSEVGVSRSALWTCYAMAENSFAVSSAADGSALDDVVRLDAASFGAGLIAPRDDGNGIEMVSCGPPVYGTEVAIVDSDTGIEVDGRVGEIVLKSGYMLREYYESRELSDAAIDSRGWYHTGDLGFLNAGSVYITGRKKDLLIVGGRNFYPQDIERICDSFEGTIPGRSVALGVIDEKLGTEKVILLAETRLEDDGEKSRISGAIRKAVFDELDCPLSDVRLLPHMWLLKTSSGKIARQPNLKKYQDELASKPVIRNLPARTSPRWGAMIGWSLTLSLTIYAAILMLAQGGNQSWNVYMRF